MCVYWTLFLSPFLFLSIFYNCICQYVCPSLPISICTYLLIFLSPSQSPHLCLPLSCISLPVYSACITAISHIKLQGVEFLSALYQITLLTYLALFLFYNAKLVYTTKGNYTHLVTRANKLMDYIKIKKHALVKKSFVQMYGDNHKSRNHVDDMQTRSQETAPLTT